ncbi:MAG TPA: phosphate signaling complex protein PhoU [Chitinispirillaceae bacterium]|nr:phosphate signaling complex protein PhoU [Chitinispirillaceae bacterium]
MVIYRQESLQRDIDRIREHVLKMSQQAQRALQDCIKAYLENNRQLAYAIILRDQHIDEKEKEIDRLCLEFLVRQQPVAGPLRFAYSTIRINLEIERVGDYAESIARQILKLYEAPNYLLKDQITELADLSINMFHDAIQAFIQQDPEAARKAIDIEATVDALRIDLNNKLVNMIKEKNCTYDTAAPLMTMIRKFERVSDQARNICNEILYMCTGEMAKHPGTEAFRILFVDDSNSCQSQIAEAVANSFKENKFIFNSAGIDPKPIDRNTIEFMKTRGIDLSRIAPKGIHQIPNLDHYQVIIALTENSSRDFPKPSRKVVFLEWPVEAVLDTTAKYEEAYNFLKSQIFDLINAIVIGEESVPERVS